MLSKVTWAHIVAPVEQEPARTHLCNLYGHIIAPLDISQEEEAERTRVCNFHGRVGCQNGEKCKFLHIQDPDALRTHWSEKKRRNKELHKVRYQLQQLMAEETRKREKAESERRAKEALMLSAPVFVPALYNQPARLMVDPGARLPTELEQLLRAYGNGLVQPRYALSEGHPLPCWRFAQDQRCDLDMCMRPHYKPLSPLYWREKKKTVVIHS